MRRADRFFLLFLLSFPLAASAQDSVVVGHRASRLGDESVLVLEHADGSSTRIVLRDGALSVDGSAVAGPVTAPFQRAWESMLSEAWELDPGQLLVRLAGIPDAAPALLERLQPMQSAAARLPAPAPRAMPAPAPEPVTVPAPEPAPVSPAARQRAERLGLELVGNVRTGDVVVARAQTVEGDLTVLDGDVSVSGLIDGNLVVLNGDVVLHPDGEIDGDVVLGGGQIIREGGRIRGEVTRVARTPAARVRQASDSRLPGGPSLGTLLAFFVALAGMGFGLTFYLPKQLDVLTDTVRESFGKSFLAGLFTQPLLVPAFALAILGLVVTVVGILLIPIAVPVLVMALLAVATAGYIAVARAIGDHYVSRRLARGLPTRATPYQTTIYGLCALFAVWLPSALLGWIPFVGQILTAMALVFTWVMVTAGLGAAVLSQAGLRATLRKPGPRYLTDEHFWLPPASGRP